MTRAGHAAAAWASAPLRPCTSSPRAKGPPARAGTAETELSWGRGPGLLAEREGRIIRYRVSEPLPAVWWGPGTPLLRNRCLCPPKIHVWRP